MLRLIVVLAVLAIGYAAPVDREMNATEPMVVPNPMIGKCTLQELAHSSVECEREFMLSFREKTRPKCSDQLDTLKSCMVSEIEFCFQNSSKTVFDAIFKEFNKTMEKQYESYCSGDIFNQENLVSKLKGIGDFCTSNDTGKQLIRCMKPFMKKLKENPGNPELCGYYGKAMGCAKKTVLTFCKTFPTTWMFNKEMNPFCDEHQIEEMMGGKKEGEDEDYDHNHDDHDHDDHDEHDKHEDHDHDDDHDHNDHHRDSKEHDHEHHDHDDH